MSIVLPIGMSFERWAANLLIDFSSPDIPIQASEDQWQLFAVTLKDLNVFQNDDIPSPYGFTQWQDWAIRVCQTVNG